MKKIYEKNKTIINYIILSLILYLIGFLIVLGVSHEYSGGSEMFAGLHETLLTLFFFVIFISITLFIRGIFILKKDLTKDKIKKSIITFIIITIILSILLYPSSIVTIVFIIPTSLISSYIINKSNNKTVIRIIYILFFLFILYRIILNSYLYIKYNQDVPEDNLNYTCNEYIISNDKYYYCQTYSGIKRVDKNTLKERKYKHADFLFSKESYSSIDYINNRNNTNYIYYTIYIETNSLDADYELHVIDINNNTDKTIKYLKKEIIMSAITDEKGNLFFRTDNSKDKEKAYYYKPEKDKILQIDDKNKIYNMYYLKNDIVYYNTNNEKEINYKSYNLINNKHYNNNTIENNPDITYNSKYITINGFKYQLYQNKIIIYDISDYSKKEVIDTKQNYIIKNGILNNNKLYLFSQNNRINKLLGYYDLESKTFTNLNYDFDTINYNYTIDNNYLYYINKEDNTLYKYNLINNEKNIISNKIDTLLNIDNNKIYIKANNSFKAIDK